MFAYYLRLALHSFRRTPGLTALMVMAIALGISVCMVTLTSYRASARIPLPDKKDTLFVPNVDSWDPAQSYENFKTPFRETQFAVLTLSTFYPNPKRPKGWDAPRAMREVAELAAQRWRAVAPVLAGAQVAAMEIHRHVNFGMLSLVEELVP